ncbi:MAG: GNAT family N-acetyltransferase [Ktedonobacteraceae bacterium]|jgi:RimJ/RimL family protein N-acetyltransferase
MIIRRILLDDAEQMRRLRLRLDEETQFMLFEPGEREISLEEQKRQIEDVLARENQMIFVAEEDGQLVGYLSATGGYVRRNRHSAEIVIGILQGFRGQGIGSQLFVAMEEWARQQHLHRLELTVMTHNTAGVALYKKQGFAIEGTRRHALIVNGQYVDEFYMAKILG